MQGINTIPTRDLLSKQMDIYAYAPNFKAPPSGRRLDLGLTSLSMGQLPLSLKHVDLTKRAYFFERIYVTFLSRVWGNN